MMRFIFLFFGLCVSSYAQDNACIDNLAYPDLIPVLVNDSLYGYCDQDLNLKIKPKFERAGLFEEDFHFQILHVHNPEIVQYGTRAYAWANINGERYRINTKGEAVYKYNAKDFKTGETAIHLSRDSVQYVVNHVDEKTLFQQVKDRRTGRRIYPDEQFLKKLKKKNKDLVEQGITIVYYPKFKELPFSYFTSEETFLRGIKNTETGEIMIKARYVAIDELYNNSLRVQQYPLFIGYRGDLNRQVYVGLNGTEYIIEDK